MALENLRVYWWVVLTIPAVAIYKIFGPCRTPLKFNCFAYQFWNSATAFKEASVATWRCWDLSTSSIWKITFTIHGRTSRFNTILKQVVSHNDLIPNDIRKWSFWLGDNSAHQQTARDLVGPNFSASDSGETRQSSDKLFFVNYVRHGFPGSAFKNSKKVTLLAVHSVWSDFNKTRNWTVDSWHSTEQCCSMPIPQSECGAD